MIKRSLESTLRELMREFPVVTVTGPRQSGKTTLCQMTFPRKPYVNLEAPDTRLFAQEDPRGFLAQFPNGAILDEFQRVPDLLSYLQPLVDERKKNGIFLLTGSQQLEVLDSVGQSLAGRTALLKLLPLALAELKGGFRVNTIDELIWKGFYPRIHVQKINPGKILANYIETYVERDLRQLINVKDLRLFQRFLGLCAGRVGQILNLNSLANDVGVSQPTARTWLSILEASFIIFLLPPFFRNFSKRLIKSPKLYFVDVGLAAHLLGISDLKHVSRDPLRGGLFENLVVMEALKNLYNAGKRSNLFFFRDSSGNEVDLVIEKGRELHALEIKSGATVVSDFFSSLKGFRKVVGADLLSAWVVYGGEGVQVRSDYSAIPLARLPVTLNAIQK